MENEKLNTLEQLYNPSSPDNSGGRFKVIIFIIVGILLVAAALFGASKFLHLQIPFMGSQETEVIMSPTPTVAVTPTDTPTPTPEPTATPSAIIKPSPTAKAASTVTPKPTISVNPVDSSTSLDRSKLSVTILNGSGVSGAAKKASDILTNLGYNVTSTGNADNYDYANTVIEVKSDKKDYLTLLKKDLSGSYTIGTTSATLSSSTSADARVIVGKQ